MNSIAAPAAQGAVARQLVQRSRDMIPALRARARDAEKLRRLHPDTIADFIEAGILRVWQPRRYGGHEVDLLTGLETMQEVARGCTSSAWCLTVYQQHSWIVSLFPGEAQDECLGADNNARVTAVLQPRGKARKVPGGYRLTGAWPFGSGSDHSTWIMLGGLVVDEAGNEIKTERTVYGMPAINARLCLMPSAEVKIRGDWDTAGLAATGSHTLEVNDIFVPEHRTLFIPDAIEKNAPGQQLNRSSLFRTPYYAFLNTALGGLAPGIAQGALDAFLDNIDTRMVPPINLPQSKLIRTHRQIADVASRIESAKLLFVANSERIMQAGETDTDMPILERARCRLNTAWAVHQCYEAVETIFLAAGGSTLSMKHPIQRAMRDMHGVKAHYFMDLETAQELYGMIQLGRTPFTYVF